jgi:hypothetical protein
MNKLNDNEKDVIDRYYGEADSETTDMKTRVVTIGKVDVQVEKEAEVKADAVSNAVTDSAIESEFEKELNKSMKTMDVFSDNDITVPNDFFSIIEKAEEIRSEKESNREFVIFILTSLGILLSIAAITIKLGIEIFITMQVALYFILPISLIPISIAAVKRGEAR